MQEKKSLYCCSALSAGIAEVVTIPVCTTKTVYQTNVLHQTNSITQTFKKIYEKGGIKAFYKGTTPAFTAQILTASLRITFYEYLIRNQQLPFFVAGVVSAVLVTVITHPLDVVRIVWQTSAASNTTGKLPFIYTGWTKSFYKAVIGGATFLPLRSFIKEKNPNLTSFQINLLTAIISTTIITPIDYFKTAVIGNNKITSKDIMKNPFKGLSLNLLRVVPHFTIMMTVFDFLIKKI